MTLGGKELKAADWYPMTHPNLHTNYYDWYPMTHPNLLKITTIDTQWPTTPAHKLLRLIPNDPPQPAHKLLDWYNQWPTPTSTQITTVANMYPLV